MDIKFIKKHKESKVVCCNKKHYLQNYKNNPDVNIIQAAKGKNVYVIEFTEKIN